MKLIVPYTWSPEEGLSLEKPLLGLAKFLGPGGLFCLSSLPPSVWNFILIYLTEWTGEDGDFRNVMAGSPQLECYLPPVPETSSNIYYSLTLMVTYAHFPTHF